MFLYFMFTHVCWHVAFPLCAQLFMVRPTGSALDVIIDA